MKKIKNFLKKKGILLSIVTLTFGAACYEIYQLLHLIYTVDVEQHRTAALNEKDFSLNRNIEKKRKELKNISQKNREIINNLKTSIIYNDVPSLNSIITNLLIRNKVKLLSLNTVEENEKNSLKFIVVNLSIKGSEDSVIKFLDSLNSKLPLKIQSLKLMLPAQNLIMNLTFKVPVIEVRRL